MAWLDRGDGVKLAYDKREGAGPTLVFLPGYNSNRQGTKAVALDLWCEQFGRALLRLEYSGHGDSEGPLEGGTIGGWAEDAARVIQHAAPGPLVLVGSSMGGWIALLLARKFGARVAGIVLIAPAVNYSEDLLWGKLNPFQQRQVMEQGSARVMVGPTEFLVTREFIEDGRKNSLGKNGRIPIQAPIRLLHGQQDKAVPWRVSLRVAEAVASPDVRITLVKDGDHRLSRPEDLLLLLSFFGPDGL